MTTTCPPRPHRLVRTASPAYAMARSYRNKLPNTADELTALVTNPAAMAKVVADPSEMHRFVGMYAEAFAQKDPDFEQRVEDERQRVLAQMLREGGFDGPRVDLRNRGDLGPSRVLNRQAPGGRDAPGAGLNGVFDSLADFLQTVHPKANVHDDVVAGKLRKVANYSSTVPSEGGFLVPETYRSEIMYDALEQSIVRPRATVIPMSSLRAVVPAVDSTTNASSVFGGVVAYWTEEGAPVTESEADFGRVVLDAKKLTAYAEAPNELVADAPAFTAFLQATMPAAVAFYEDLAFLTGTGAGEPQGAYNCAASVEVAKESGQAADTIVWENVGKMFARMLPGSLSSAVWVASIDTLPELLTMALSVGTGGSAIWVNNGAAGPPMNILGRPVLFTEKTPTLGSKGDISFVDFRHYLLGDRMALEARMSEHYKFGHDKTAFRFIERCDGRPWVQSAITPANGGDTLSPFVHLAART